MRNTYRSTYRYRLLIIQERKFFDKETFKNISQFAKELVVETTTKLRFHAITERAKKKRRKLSRHDTLGKSIFEFCFIWKKKNKKKFDNLCECLTRSEQSQRYSSLNKHLSNVARAKRPCLKLKTSFFFGKQ